MDTMPIENLRQAFAQSIIATMGTQVSTYLRLVAHPDVQFGDLLDALARNSVIGDDAAHRLHRRLNLPASAGPPVVQRGHWERILNERRIAITALFHAPDDAIVTPQPEPAPEAH